jgi:hypothetical protein
LITSIPYLKFKSSAWACDVCQQCIFQCFVFPMESWGDVFVLLSTLYYIFSKLTTVQPLVGCTFFSRAPFTVKKADHVQMTLTPKRCKRSKICRSRLHDQHFDRWWIDNGGQRPCLPWDLKLINLSLHYPLVPLFLFFCE